MCISPLTIETKYQGEKVAAACRKCTACVQARKRHWIGRMLAEEQTCHSVWFVTLTYAGGYDNINAYVINYHDVQLFFKRLRKAGHKFKYVAVGEHGTDLDRAHFHIMIFWQNEPPDVPMDTQAQWDAWPHGHSNCQIPRSKQGCAVYLMDYMNKDNLQRAVMKYSKNPMLGHEYLIQYAERHVSNGLSLFAESDRFTIPDNKSQSGKPFYYPVGRETSLYSKMIDAYLLKWAKERPDQPLPLNEEISEYLGDLCQDTSELPIELQQFISRHYGYEPVESIEYDIETTYAVKNANLIQRGRMIFGEIYNGKEMIWHGVVEGRAEQNGRELLSPRQLNQLLVQLSEIAPPRCKPWLTCHDPP